MANFGGSINAANDDYNSVASYGAIEQINKQVSPEKTGNQLGTFSGVFVPAMLGIFGVVTFLRMGWVVGQAGLLLTYVILIYGNLCTLTTAASLSAVATNGRMKGGGAYYLISRSLGPEFGGSIGVIFFLANVFSCGVTVQGFVNATGTALSKYDFYTWVTEDPTHQYWLAVGLGSIILFFLTIVCGFGADAFIKVLIVIYFVEVFSLFFSLVSFMFQKPNVIEGYTGWSTETCRNNIFSHWDDGNDFHTVFAVWFPALSGIMAGANMSGDLKDPSKSIPKGTFCAIIFASTLYTIEMTVMSCTVTSDALKNYAIMQEISFWQPIITIGIYAASLSSTISSLAGAARVFQALAKDEILPFIKLFGRGFGKGNEPLYALALTYVLAQILLFKQNLNILATISSMFFLFSYSLTNLACFALEIAGAPNFRPKYKYFKWYTSLLGTLINFAACFIVSYVLASVALVCVLILFLYIYFFTPPREWGDVKQAIIFHQVRKFLLFLDVRKSHAKNWRPSILLLLAHPHSSRSIIEFVNAIKKGGMYIISTVLIGDCSPFNLSMLKTLKKGYLDYLSNTNTKAFDEVIISPSFLVGVRSMLMTAGIGVLKPNTVAFGFPSQLKTESEMSIRDEILTEFEYNKDAPLPEVSLEEYLACLNEALLFEKNVLITRNFKNFNLASISGGSKKSRWGRKLAGAKRKKIDCWLILPSKSEFVNSPSMTLTVLFGWILSRARYWRDHTNLRIIAVCSNVHREEAENMINSLLVFCRLEVRTLLLSLDEEVDSLPVNITKPDGSLPWLYDLPLAERFLVANYFIRKHSHSAAAIFVPLPNPPATSPENAEYYFNSLEALSRNLPPTVMIRGVSNVIVSDL